MEKVYNVFLKGLPHIDLHGYDRESALFKVDEFIRENVQLGNYKVVIIHGVGTGILRTSIRSFLEKNKKVESFQGDFFNRGITVVSLFTHD